MERIVQDISTFIFIEDTPDNADIIFIPGCGHPQVAENAANLYKQGYAPLILPSGKCPKNKNCFGGAYSKKEQYPGPYKTEAAFLRDVLLQNGVVAEAILCEEKATYTHQNALHSKEITDKLGLSVKKAILSCQPYHARRCLMYYQIVYPTAHFVVLPTETRGITKYNWHTTKEGSKLVLGELAKCGTQFTETFENRIACE